VWLLYWAMDFSVNSLPAKFRDSVRPFVFAGPAMAILGVYLVYPAINTVIISLQDRTSDKFVGLDNFVTLFTEEAYRRTLINSAVWVLFAPLVTVAIGLAFATLADRLDKRSEAIAKSVIFLPMAISFVGASIVWRFVYSFRPEGFGEQIGILNALRLTDLFDFATSNFLTLFLLFLIPVALGIGAHALSRRMPFDSRGQGALKGAATILIYLPAALVALGAIAALFFGKSAQPVDWRSWEPWNNGFLMVILVWLQVGFSMVILSSAIKGVPDDILEAARIDGATEWQVFWKVTFPSVASTVVVVWTTVVITVWKLFDIVWVMTGGQFNTSVVAEKMVREFFTNANNGLGAALAVLLFIAVIPVLIINVRRFQAQEATR
jgi:alpha-glucoside transport system permease protein